MVHGLETMARLNAEAEAKPPVGLTPRWLWAEQRANDILDAMARYRKRDRLIPCEWLEELGVHLESVYEHFRGERQQSYFESDDEGLFKCGKSYRPYSPQELFCRLGCIAVSKDEKPNTMASISDGGKVMVKLYGFSNAHRWYTPQEMLEKFTHEDGSVFGVGISSIANE